MYGGDQIKIMFTAYIVFGESLLLLLFFPKQNLAQVHLDSLIRLKTESFARSQRGDEPKIEGGESHSELELQQTVSASTEL